ncbi:MAG: hypothetical protein ACRD1X_14310 [Vicinamibacteria bacterium]
MKTKRQLTWMICLIGGAALTVSALYAAAAEDFGKTTENLLRGKALQLFGFVKPLDASATSADVIAREFASAGDRQFLAHGLQAEFVARNVANLGDMISFWPDDTSATHLIVCIEQGRSGTTPGGNGGLNPSVQRVNLATAAVATILHGMSRCDGIRTTPWGTVLATEETGDGGAYEILDPLNTTDHWIANRGTGDIRDAIDSLTPSQNVVKRTALVMQAWEGLTILDNGVVIAGDELRPNLDDDGGALFRFVPDNFYDCGSPDPVRPGQLCDNTINNLGDSPVVSGQNYALATVCNGTADFGQGCESSRGLWVEVGAPTARADANDRGATGYCRPEDLHTDKSFGMFVGDEGIRYCWTNTCGGGDGEALCAVENEVDAFQTVFNSNFGFNLLAAVADPTDPAEAHVTRFVLGDDQLNSHDNLDIQIHTSNVYLIEDTDFGDVWACLPDGEDRDFMTDGCVRMLSIRDPDAEPTGFIFDGAGTTAYYILQHGQQPPALLDFGSNPVNGTTDDLVRITGFKIPNP